MVSERRVPECLINFLFCRTNTTLKAKKIDRRHRCQPNTEIMTIYATLAVVALEALMSSGKLPRVVETCIELARAGNLAGLQWARFKGIPFDAARCLEVATSQAMRDWIKNETLVAASMHAARARLDPINLIPLAAVSMFRLCANPIPHFVRPNRPSDFGEIPELPF